MLHFKPFELVVSYTPDPDEPDPKTCWPNLGGCLFGCSSPKCRLGQADPVVCDVCGESPCECTEPVPDSPPPVPRSPSPEYKMDLTKRKPCRDCGRWLITCRCLPPVNVRKVLADRLPVQQDVKERRGRQISKAIGPRFVKSSRNPGKLPPIRGVQGEKSRPAYFPSVGSFSFTFGERAL
jgi:hypothetical protein